MMIETKWTILNDSVVEVNIESYNDGRYVCTDDCGNVYAISEYDLYETKEDALAQLEDLPE